MSGGSRHWPCGNQSMPLLDSFSMPTLPLGQCIANLPYLLTFSDTLSVLQVVSSPSSIVSISDLELVQLTTSTPEVNM